MQKRCFNGGNFEACKFSAAEELIKKLPNGYDTLIEKME